MTQHQIDYYLPTRCTTILPPILPRKQSKNFNSIAWLDKINITRKDSQEISPLLERSTNTNTNTINDKTPNASKSKRTQSLYSLQSKNDIATKIRTEKKHSPTRNNVYNKWFIPPNKRFVDLKQESAQFILEQQQEEAIEVQRQHYKKIFKDQKLFLSIIQDFKKNYKRNPAFIH